MRIAVAMSGGIDSSVAAIVLKQAGHDIVGITGNLCSGIIREQFGPSFASGGVDSARSTADRFGFPLHVIDLEEEFASLVIEPFCMEYMAGRTPNPCIFCDSKIKFDRFLAFAKSLECDKIASGHYAKILMTNSGRFYVSRGKEISKDQSYFLFMLSQISMRDMILPLGEYTKAWARETAKRFGLAALKRPESQEICFVPDNRYPEFIERMTGLRPGPGEIVDTNGSVIGRHRGIHRYTIGQRRGLGIASSRPLYVVAVDAEKNRIVAGFREDLETHALFADSICHMKETDLDGLEVRVKTRSTQAPVPASLKVDDGGILVSFREPQTGISPGQAVVFYNEGMDVLGGGIIARAVK
jgi:tRNA-specific 2-thiouridylase